MESLLTKQLSSVFSNKNNPTHQPCLPSNLLPVLSIIDRFSSLSFSSSIISPLNHHITSHQESNNRWMFSPQQDPMIRCWFLFQIPVDFGIIVTVNILPRVDEVNRRVELRMHTISCCRLLAHKSSFVGSFWLSLRCRRSLLLWHKAPNLDLYPRARNYIWSPHVFYL